MSAPRLLEELRPAEEVARGMVRIRAEHDGRRVAQIEDDDDWVALEIQENLADTQDIASEARSILARLIERERKAAFEAGRRSVGSPAPAPQETWEDSEDGERVRVEVCRGKPDFYGCEVVRACPNGLGVGCYVDRHIVAPRWARVEVASD